MHSCGDNQNSFITIYMHVDSVLSESFYLLFCHGQIILKSVFEILGFELHLFHDIVDVVIHVLCQGIIWKVAPRNHVIEAGDAEVTASGHITSH